MKLRALSSEEVGSLDELLHEQIMVHRVHIARRRKMISRDDLNHTEFLSKEEELSSQGAACV